MKIKKSIVDRRRDNILAYIKNKEEVTTQELVDEFDVSEITIRRDLNFLQSIGRIDRFYGGAKVNTEEDPQDLIVEEKKERIAQKCAEFIKEYDDIFINSSSTALLVLKYLKNKRINVITNNGKALNLDLDPHVTVTLTGGKISYPKNALTGPFTINNLKNLASDITIIGISGVTPDGKLTTSLMDEVEINQYMINESTSKNILVCDSSKFYKAANFKIGDIDKIDIVITDDNIERKTIEMLEKHAVQLIIV
ncbi:DeoR/GlpR family DNA-binding transcription regulator [uncultured Anaerococcus sp.]|uniref:DeoR/GlpR family DNA-binding transcription regulator n=1 Tax=uncultured Anaerococcus sp. TaxID=293428 RepID=UPI0025D9E94E|nr:DeoR/GlpR family DNA-binding transcription regulator [uncultured Anaerococcus sp.]